MSTTLANARIELSKQLRDDWVSATTSAGNAGGTTMIDSALIAKANDWITDETYDLITEAAHAALNEERRITSLDNSTGTVTVHAAHGAPTQIASGVDYELHRLATASDKRRALIAACRTSYPAIHERIWDESLVSHNWLKDGSFEIWTSTSALTNWTKAGSSTLAQTSTAYYFKHGSYSCKISGAADNIRQSVTNHDDLKKLAGKTVTFTLQGWCDTASCLRIAIYDGTTYTYSDYHDGDSAWTEDDDPLEVEATIKDNPTVIAFIIYHASASGISYVDDARVISDVCPRMYIGNLGLAQNQPVQLFIERSNYSNVEPWHLIHNAVIDYENGYMYLPSSVSPDYRLRIKGKGYLDFLASGVSSTAWTATVNVDQPQLDILIAEAILYLYTEMAMPNFTQGTRKDYQEMIGYWKQEAQIRRNKFGMTPLSIPVDWGLG